ncbi:hypothetical protein [Synechococcus sp. PCC 7336]|uniref:hypothetical protein n=1 Tax=Synechococcus sp. PCC 7336 TaxID=195250 RepID=UPI000348CD8F|nr:hypothetical protein [Synechococcus sp. PCC 7336]
MLSTFRDRHPWGSIVTDLLRVEEGLYIVRAQAIVNQVTLGSGIAGSTTVEDAEDAAIQRALRVAGLDGSTPLTLGTVAAPAIAPSAMPTPPANGNTANYAGEPPTSWSAPTPSTPEPSPAPSPLPELELEDLSELIAQTDVELTRIGWGPKEGRNYLKKRFGKQSRQQLDEQELREFLRDLKQKPTQMAADAF